VNFDLSDEQKVLKAQAARLLADQAPPSRLRRLIEAGEDWDPGVWRALGEMGYLGAAIPEAYGGQGIGQIELCVLSEELGRAVAPVPFFSSICLAAEAIGLAGSEEQKARWLPELASGRRVGCLAYNEGRGVAGDRLEASVTQGKVSGVKWPVSDAGVAGVSVVVAKDRDRVVLGLVDLSQGRVTRTRLTGFDQLRPHYRLEFADAPFEVLAEADADEVLRLVFDRAATRVAFEQIGGAEACLWMARNYAMERRTFGRVLASYQAVKHKLADILVYCELARSNAYFAACALEDDPVRFPAAAATARISATRAYEVAARENLQTHGGIGYTWDANCHYHYRRARLLALNIGAEEIWADRLIDSLLLSEPSLAA
jgi:alkylation response protein AidB-like acyl-CoA dehydrogenase